MPFSHLSPPVICDQNKSNSQEATLQAALCLKQNRPVKIKALNVFLSTSALFSAIMSPPQKAAAGGLRRTVGVTVTAKMEGEGVNTRDVIKEGGDGEKGCRGRSKCRMRCLRLSGTIINSVCTYTSNI